MVPRIDEHTISWAAKAPNKSNGSLQADIELAPSQNEEAIRKPVFGDSGLVIDTRVFVERDGKVGQRRCVEDRLDLFALGVANIPAEQIIVDSGLPGYGVLIWFYSTGRTQPASLDLRRAR